MTEAVDETMAGCILDLYRSAARVHHDWGPDFVDIPKPGMVVIPTADPFLNAVAARRSAERRGAGRDAGRCRSLVDGRGPRCSGALLERFWSSVEGG